MEMQAAPWERYGGAAPPDLSGTQQPAAPRILVPRQATPQTPGQARGQDLGNQRTGQQISQSDTRGVNFSDERSLANDYIGLPAVRDYNAIAPSVQAARRVRAGGAGDLDLVYAFAKIMDPGSVVREGEVQMSENTGGLGDRVHGYLQGLRNGQRLPNNVRQNLLAEIENRVSQYRSAYQQFRKQYWNRAERYGFDPESVVGPDIDAAFEPGPNAPGANGDLVGMGQNLMQGAANNLAGVNPARQLPALNAPGGLTTTDRHESAQSNQYAAPGTEDLTGTATNPRINTQNAIAYNDAWVAAVNSGLDREGLNQWVRENAPRYFPNRTPGVVDDRMWNMIQESRRTGQGLDWQPLSTGINDLTGPYSDAARATLQQNYQDQADARQGAADREAYAAEHPFLASVDTVGRRVANAATLGTADRISGLLSGRGAAYEHGVTGEDWRSRPVESIAGSMVGGSRLPYGTGFGRQVTLGSIYSGAEAFNDADGTLADRFSAGFHGAGMGGATNTGVAALQRAFRAPNADEILAAGERQGVTIPRYMTGSAPAHVAAGAVGTTAGRIPLGNAAERVVEGLEGARNRAASAIGDVGDEFEAGRRAQSGARDWLRSTQERADQLFSRIPIRPETPTQLANTRQALGELTEGLSSNPELSSLLEDRRLLAFRDALQGNGLSWADLRRFRSMIGEQIGQPQVAGEVTSRAALRRLYGAITDDMQATAQAQGPRALTMFNRANQYYRGREARREGIITDILGNDGNAAPEDTFRMINRWAQRGTGDTTSLAQTMRSLPREDADAVRASIFARMGRATSRQQNESGEVFSPYTFATQWDQLAPRAKALLVPNASHRRNLDDIALLASSMRRSERFTNFSNTGLGSNLGILGLIGMGAGPTGAAGAAALSYGMGRMLASPAGSRTLLRALRNPENFTGAVSGSGQDQPSEQ